MIRGAVNANVRKKKKKKDKTGTKPPINSVQTAARIYTSKHIHHPLKYPAPHANTSSPPSSPSPSSAANRSNSPAYPPPPLSATIIHSTQHRTRGNSPIMSNILIRLRLQLIRRDPQIRKRLRPRIDLLVDKLPLHLVWRKCRPPQVVERLRHRL